MSVKLYVKNMVCPRCMSAVEHILEQLGIGEGSHVELGSFTLPSAPGEEVLQKLENALGEQGFALLKDETRRLTEQMKTLLVELVYEHDAELSTPLSSYITSRIPRDYDFLSSLFRQVHGQTVERYFITLKMERVRELLFYGELTLSEIAFKLHFSSVAHLSAQFKRETGLTPTQFRQLRQPHHPLTSL